MPSGLRAAKALSFSPMLPLLMASTLEYWPVRWLGVPPLTLIVKVCAVTPLVSLAAKANS